jgi:membrane-associated protein
MPIVRTFAPFVAGIGEMRYRQFLVYNIGGAVIWVVSFLALGFFFGNQPAVKKNFTLVIGAIIVISVLPAIYELVRARKEL